MTPARADDADDAVDAARTRGESLRALQRELSRWRVDEAATERRGGERASLEESETSEEEDEAMTPRASASASANASASAVVSVAVRGVDGVDRTSDATSGTSEYARVRVDADMEVRLRRAELRKVDLELKLANSFEKVELARRALEEARAIHEMYKVEFEDAQKEFEEQQELVYEELERREEEAKALQMASMQAAAIKRADECRQRADAAFKRGDIGEAEQLYSHAIAELEVSGITLVDPSHLWLRINRATALFALGHVRESLSECELVLKVDSNHIRALSRAAKCCLNLEELERAERYIEFISLSPAADSADLKDALSQKSTLIRAFVERDKVAGNEAFRDDDFHTAARLYSSALDSLDSMYLSDVAKVKVGLLSNRAAALMMLGNPLQAAEDCCAALKIDKAHLKAQVRLARCLLQLGQFDEARQEASDILSNGVSTAEQQVDAQQVIDDVDRTQELVNDSAEQLWQIEDNGDESVDAHSVLRVLDEAKVFAPHSTMIKTFRAEGLRFIGEIAAAAILVKDAPIQDVRGLCVRARIAFELANVSDCLDSLKPLIPALDLYAGRDASHCVTFEEVLTPDEVLKQIPNPASLLQILEQVCQINELKERGKEAFGDANYDKAISLYTEALGLCKNSDTLQALFLSNICACEQATERYVDALASAGAACALAPKYAKAHARLAAIYTELDMVSDAQQTYEALLIMGLSEDERVKVESYLMTITGRVNAETPVNWRKLLGVGPKPSKDVLKKKYRQLALNHHPDKASRGCASATLAKARVVVSSKLFNLISEAYNILNNDNAVIKWENARVRAQYKSSRPCNESPTYARAPFGDSNEFYSRY